MSGTNAAAYRQEYRRKRKEAGLCRECKKEIKIMTKSRSFASAIILMIWLITACVPVAAPAPAATTAMAPVPAAPTGTPPAATPTLAPATVTPTLTALPGALLPVRGLVAQFERRGASEGYWMGEMLQLFDTRDDLVGHTVREEVALQLDEMEKMGVNTIRYELRSASPASSSACRRAFSRLANSSCVIVGSCTGMLCQPELLALLGMR